MIFLRRSNPDLISEMNELETSPELISKTNQGANAKSVPAQKNWRRECCQQLGAVFSVLSFVGAGRNHGNQGGWKQVPVCVFWWSSPRLAWTCVVFWIALLFCCFSVVFVVLHGIERVYSRWFHHFFTAVGVVDIYLSRWTARRAAAAVDRLLRAAFSLRARLWCWAVGAITGLRKRQSKARVFIFANTICPCWYHRNYSGYVCIRLTPMVHRTIFSDTVLVCWRGKINHTAKKPCDG